MRPGYELGFKDNGKYYIFNHLVFNVLVTRSHGEYIAALDKTNSLSAGLDMDSRRRSTRRQLLARGEHDSVAGATQDAVASAVGAGCASKSSRQLKGSSGDAGDSGTDTYWMVVGFEVSPCSIARDADKPVDEVICGVEGDAHIRPQEVVPGAKIVYTYDVYWQESTIKWTSRWDAYLRMPGGQVGTRVAAQQAGRGAAHRLKLTRLVPTCLCQAPPLAALLKRLHCRRVLLLPAPDRLLSV